MTVDREEFMYVGDEIEFFVGGLCKMEGVPQKMTNGDCGVVDGGLKWVWWWWQNEEVRGVQLVGERNKW